MADDSASQKLDSVTDVGAQPTMHAPAEASLAPTPAPAAPVGHEPAAGAAPAAPPAAEPIPEPAPEPADGQAATVMGDSAAVLSHDWTGRQIAGRYSILEKLGEGGMGVVYIAEHLNLKKKVAFKVIHPELAANEELLARFTREALATGQLDHAHICAAIDFDKIEDGSAFLVMPFVRGHSMQAVLDSGGGLAWREVCRFGAQIADALSAAHAVGIIHRDLKPDNVLVEQLPDGSQSAKVLDFGVASLTGASESISSATSKPLTQAGMILGTPGYMSPEQATAGEIDHRTDLYALGVMMWELTRGERLFDARDVTEIFARQFNSVPDPLNLADTGPAKEFAELVAQLLLPQKAGRPESAALVRDRLRRLAEAPEPTGVTRTLATGTRQAEDFWTGLSNRGRAGVAAAAVVVLGLLGVMLSGDTPEADTSADSSGKSAAVDGADEESESPKQRKSKSKNKTADSDDSDAEQGLVDKVSNMLGVLPAELSEAEEQLGERSRNSRRKAARVVSRYKGPTEVPGYLALWADLELARGCRDRRAVILKMRTLDDARVLPALDRLDKSPKRGCPPLGLRDCNQCLRKDLTKAIGALE